MCLCPKLLQSCPTLCNLWTRAHQAPLSVGFCKQDYWSGGHAFLQGICPMLHRQLKPRSIKPRFCEFDSRKGISALICWAQGYNRAHLCNVLTDRLHQQTKSVSKSCLTLCKPRACSTGDLPVSHYLFEFAQAFLNSMAVTQNNIGSSTAISIKIICFQIHCLSHSSQNVPYLSSLETLRVIKEEYSFVLITYYISWPFLE